MGKAEIEMRRQMIIEILREYQRISKLSGISTKQQEQTINEGLDKLIELKKEEEEREKRKKK